MSFSLLAKIRVKTVYDITPELLLYRGIKLLMLDLDNTLAPYGGGNPEPDLLKWKSLIESAGIRVFIVSNTRTDRAKHFAAKFGTSFINRAGKPSPEGILKVLTICGFSPGEAALAGDQLFTDVLGANRAAVTSIILNPLELRHPLRAIRYALELPFRILRRREKHN